MKTCIAIGMMLTSAGLLTAAILLMLNPAPAGKLFMEDKFPSGLVELIRTTPLNENDRRAIAVGLIPPSAFDAYVESLGPASGPPRRIGPNAWELTMADGSVWTAFGDVGSMKDWPKDAVAPTPGE